MSAPNTVILSAPSEWTTRQGLEALLAQFGCEQVITDWSPGCAHVGGALHITAMRPEALMKYLQSNKPWLARYMHSRGWNEQRQRIADMQRQVTRGFMQALGGLALFVVGLGIVGPAIDVGGNEPEIAARAMVDRGERIVQRDQVAWTDRHGQQQQRAVITVLHRGAP